METTIELTLQETKVVDDLTLTHKSGGHKILMNDKGGRGGDMSVANISFQTPRLEPIEKRFYNKQVKETFQFDHYRITVVSMTWNGVTVTLNISKIDSPPSSSAVPKI